MHKISFILSGVLFVLGCITLGIGIICSDVLPKLIEIYLISHPVSYSDKILQINSANIYLLSFAELILGTFGYLYFRKKG